MAKLVGKLKQHSGLTRIVSSNLYLQMFSCLQFGDADPRSRDSGECHASRNVEDQFKSFHIRVSWSSSADFDPKMPLLFFFFSVCETKQKEVHIRAIQDYKVAPNADAIRYILSVDFGSAPSLLWTTAFSLWFC